MSDEVKVERGSRVRSEPSRDSRHTEVGKVALLDRYPPPGECLLGRFTRAATAMRRWRPDAPCRSYSPTRVPP